MDHLRLLRVWVLAWYWCRENVIVDLFHQQPLAANQLQQPQHQRPQSLVQYSVAGEIGWLTTRKIFSPAPSVAHHCVHSSSSRGSNIVKVSCEL
jgi:hypothetical protein